MSKSDRKRQNTIARRKQIIEVLRKLIIKYGSEHVTVRRIAEEIGITEGAIYRHFKSKREILSFLVDYIEENLMEDLKGSHSSSDVLDLLENTLQNHLSAIEQRRGISFLVIAEIISLGDKRLNKKIFGVLNKYIGQLNQILTEGVRKGQIREDINLDMAAMMFFGMIQGLTTIWALSNYTFALEEKHVAMWRIFCEAIKKHGSQSLSIHQ